jgi:hypothetical protein
MLFLLPYYIEEANAISSSGSAARGPAQIGAVAQAMTEVLT